MNHDTFNLIKKFLKESFSWFVSLTENMYIILTQTQESCSLASCSTLACTILQRAGQVGNIYIHSPHSVLLCLLESGTFQLY